MVAFSQKVREISNAVTLHCQYLAAACLHGGQHLIPTRPAGTYLKNIFIESQICGRDPEVHILGESIDDLVYLGEGCSTLENEMRFQIRIGKDFIQKPAYSEVLLQDDGVNLFFQGGIGECIAPIFGGKGQEP